MSDAGYSMLGAGAWGWPTEMLWGGRWEGGSCLGTPVRIKDFKIKKIKKKFWKKKSNAGYHAYDITCSQLKNTLLLKKKKQKTPNHHLSLQQSCSPFAVGTSKTTDDHNKYSNTLKAGSSTRITKSRPRDTKWAKKSLVAQLPQTFTICQKQNIWEAQ